MKNLKKKLAAAVSMLMVSAVMLTGVSYAWYTLSTNPEVQGITATATANANLEIAYNESAEAPDAVGVAGDTGSYDTYGNLVVMGASYTGAGTDPQEKWKDLKKVLLPMTAVADGADSTTKKFQYMTYGVDGRPATLADLAVEGASGANNGCGNIYLSRIDGDSTVKVNYGYFVRYWMRTNNPIRDTNGDNDADIFNEIMLTAAKNRDNNSTSESGDGTSISIVTNGLSVSVDKLSELVKHVRLGFSSGSGESVTPVATGVTVINPSTWGSSPITGGVKLTLPDTDISTGVKLAQNTDTQVFMYVFLDGTTMGNELADALADGAVTITVNAQFSNDGMDDDMGMNATGPRS